MASLSLDPKLTLGSDLMSDGGCAATSKLTGGGGVGLPGGETLRRAPPLVGGEI